jgi:hypothetical protein
MKKITNQIGHVQIDLFSMIKWSNWPNVKMIDDWFFILFSNQMNHDFL